MTLHKIIIPSATAVLLVVSTAACSQDSATSSTSPAPSSASSNAPRTSPSPRASVDSASSTSFADGRYEVGTAVVAGQYKMAAAQSKPCPLTIKTVSEDIDLSGDLGGTADVTTDTIESGKPTTYTVNSGRASFTFEDGDEVTSTGCGTWQKV